MTVTGDDLRHALTWGDLAAVIDLAATAVAPPKAPAAPRKAAARSAGISRQPAAVTPPPPPPARSRRLKPLTPMRQQAAKSMRRLAEGIARDHPELAVHDHVRDAARTLESGNEEAAQRHLRAAMFSLTPQSLHRNGVHDDEGHVSARQAVHGVHRHLLLVKDIADVAAKNQAAIRRDSYGDYESGPSLPHADPNAGYGPGALAQKPQARQPGGDKALNAPDRTNSGGSDPAVADPVGPQPRGSKQFSYTWNDLATVIELVSDAWRTELRGKGGEWTAAGLTALRSMSPAEKKVYTKTGALPDRMKAGSKAHDTASATASRDAKAKIAADKAARPVPSTRAELEQHTAELHGGNPVPPGRSTGPKKMTAAQVRARHAEMHAKGQLGVAHTHAEAQPASAAKPLPGGPPPTMAGLDPPYSGFLLSGPQSGSLLDYVSQEGAKVINGSLRNGKMPPGDRAAEVKAIDDVAKIFKIPKASTVYRGMATPPGMDLKPGAVFSDKGFASVSSDKAQAKDFAFARSTGKDAAGKNVEGIVKYPGKPVLMKINLPPGQPVAPGQPSLGEYLLPRGSQFRVDSVSADGSEVSVSIIPQP